MEKWVNRHLCAGGGGALNFYGIALGGKGYDDAVGHTITIKSPIQRY
jgi:hypothetical protein